MTNDRAFELGEGRIVIYAQENLRSDWPRQYLFARPAIAQEVTLRAVTAFAEKTTYSRGFEKFIER